MRSTGKDSTRIHCKKGFRSSAESEFHHMAAQTETRQLSVVQAGISQDQDNLLISGPISHVDYSRHISQTSSMYVNVGEAWLIAMWVVTLCLLCTGRPDHDNYASQNPISVIIFCENCYLKMKTIQRGKNSSAFFK